MLQDKAAIKEEFERAGIELDDKQLSLVEKIISGLGNAYKCPAVDLVIQAVCGGNEAAILNGDGTQEVPNGLICMGERNLPSKPGKQNKPHHSKKTMKYF